MLARIRIWWPRLLPFFWLTIPAVVVGWHPGAIPASGQQGFHMVWQAAQLTTSDAGQADPRPEIAARMDTCVKFTPVYFNVPAGYEMLLERFAQTRALARRLLPGWT